MKRKCLLIVALLTSFLTSCEEKKEYTTFQEYVDIVKTATKDQKDIFIFTSSSCFHCQKIESSIERYITENADEKLNIYELSVDYRTKLNGENVFMDSTMGYFTGNSENDCLKRLDNRITKYLVHHGITTDNEYIISSAVGGYYSYILTPLIIWYQGGMEVKITNNVSKNLEYDNNKNIIYDSFVEMMKFPENPVVWGEAFNISYYIEEK